MTKKPKQKKKDESYLSGEFDSFVSVSFDGQKLGNNQLQALQDAFMAGALVTQIPHVQFLKALNSDDEKAKHEGVEIIQNIQDDLEAYRLFLAIRDVASTIRVMTPEQLLKEFEDIMARKQSAEQTQKDVDEMLARAAKAAASGERKG